METKIPYQFTAVPSKLFYCLDKNCKAMLFALIDLHNLYANQDGWFFRSNKDLQDDTDLSQNLVKVVLDTLYRAGIINVFSVGQGKGHTSNRIHINFESFTRYEAYSFNDIRNNPDLHIKTLPYKDHYSPSYCERVGDNESERVSETSSENLGEKMTTILDTPDTPNTSYSIDNILDTIEKPSAKETSPMTFEEYLQCFIDRYPYINYSYSPEAFHNAYSQELIGLQTQINEDCGVVFNTDDLATSVYYFKTTGKLPIEIA